MTNKQTSIRKARISGRRFVQLWSGLGAGAGYMPLVGFSAEAPTASQENDGGASAQAAKGADKPGDVRHFTMRDPEI